MTKEQLDADRKAAEAAKRPYVHRGPNRDAPAAENARLVPGQADRPAAQGAGGPLGRHRRRDPRPGRSPDRHDRRPVILRPDGRALYNFAVVVDDVAMRITHVVRAAEHLSNTPTQVLIYEALGYPLPTFAHVPVVNEPGSKKKLSKRDMKKFRHAGGAGQAPGRRPH